MVVQGKRKRYRMVAEKDLSGGLADACSQVLVSDFYDFSSHSNCQIINFYSESPM
jgi:hypothetical protein